MKYIELLIPAVISIITAFSSFFIYRYKVIHKTKKRKNIFKIIQDLEYLKLNENFKQIFVDEYKRQILIEVKGLDISPDKFDLIQNKGILDEFSLSQIKAANNYIKVSGGELVVEIRPSDKFIAIYHFIFGLLFIAIGLGIFFLMQFYKMELIKYFLGLGLVIITTLFGSLTISRNAAPTYIAQLIKKKIKKINQPNK